MKDKDFDTYINKKLNEGKGLPYKEEYWNDMNTTLDTHMPVNKDGSSMSSVFKWGLFSAFCVSVIGFVVAYTLWNPFQPAPVNTEQTQSVSDQQSNHTPNHPSAARQSLPASSPTNFTLQTMYPQPEGTQHTNTSQEYHQQKYFPEKQSIQANNNSPSASLTTPLNPNAEPNPTTIISDEISPAQQNSVVKANEYNNAPIVESHHIVSDGLILKRTLPFSIIEKPAQSPLNILFRDESIFLPSDKKHQSFIHSINLLPFIGLIYQPQETQYPAQQSMLILPSQINMVGGINIEASIKYLSLRSGIGFSKQTVLTKEYGMLNTYKTDTSYIIINPNFGTTPTGKPLILIKRQIDSTLTSSKQTENTSTQTITYITIPLTLQYKIAYNRFTGVIEGGVVNHFTLGSTPKFTSTADKISNPVKVPTYQIQPTAGAGLRYALTAKFDIGAQYNYLMSTQNSNPVLISNAHLTTLILVYHIR